MKIRKIKYKNHPVLGNLELDMVNHDTGLPYDTIVFAGENGTGKTSILSSLSTFLNKRSLKYFDRIEYDANGNQFVAEPLDGGLHIEVGYYKRTNVATGIATNIHTAAGNREEQILADLDDLRHYGCVYTKARADYSSNAITGTKASELDKSSYDIDSSDDFTSLKQLIVDVDTLDNRDFRRTYKQASVGTFQEEVFEQSSRMYRFKQAFNAFFDKITYNGVEPNGNILDVLFTKHNKNISIDQLSTGEKQIVYRGIYLLRNVGKLDGSAIMIDEPELSMHPKWQKKILQYFKDLFKAADGSQKAQLFFATHSEYVLGEALKDQSSTLVIVLKDNNGTIEKNEVRTPLVLPTITESEINYAAFDVPSIDYHIALYGAIQSRYNKPSIISCDQFIETQCAPYYDAARHGIITSYKGTDFHTLPSMIRNHIDHPDNPYAYTETQMETSIKLMRDILRNIQ